jgi:hypothetical protein
MDFKMILGLAAVAVGLIGYWLYLRDIFRSKTRPHVFTWFVWSLMVGTAFFAQLARGGGAGAWVSGVAAVVCLFIAACAFWRGEKHITRLDWVCFIGALAGLALWKITADPLAAILVIIVVDALAFVPTIRKAFFKPEEETAGVYMASAIKYVFALAAIDSYNLTTWLYPAYLVMSNGGFVIMLCFRRRHLTPHPPRY